MDSNLNTLSDVHIHSDIIHMYRLDSRKGPKSSQHCTEKSSELFYDL